ncbi:MAG: hypothetical protein JWM19_4411 [Actinomycetia bacterium]|nr:hypothetical protein [Actinomycetes bacterium]
MTRLLGLLAVAVHLTAVHLTAVHPVAEHVVIVGVPGLRWSGVSPSASPALWRIATAGSVGDLVDSAISPAACLADAWLTLGSGTRAQLPRGPVPPGGHRCPALPAVAGNRIPAMPSIVAYNAQFNTDPDWGLLGSAASSSAPSSAPGSAPASAASCATAVGPGAALALASRTGSVQSYVPSAAEVTAGLLAHCSLTVIDLGTSRDLGSTDASLGAIAADLPPRTLLLVTAIGSPAGAVHLQAVVVNGPGYAGGLLASSSTRQPGIVTLTDLSATVAGWLGHPVPGGVPGARLARGNRGTLAPALRTLNGRDTAEQVWSATHAWFFLGYALLDLLALGLFLLEKREKREKRQQRENRQQPDKREKQRGKQGREHAGASPGQWALGCAAAVPAGTFLLNLPLPGMPPWWAHSHPAAWLYGMAACWAAAVTLAAFGAAALPGPWRHDPLAPVGLICLATMALIAGDVMTGSRLELEVPFGLSLLEAGRYYGVGNGALGVYCASALVGAAWLASLFRRTAAMAAVVAVGLLAVTAAGWPGFGAKAGAIIALVPCFLLLAGRVAGVRGNGWVAGVRGTGRPASWHRGALTVTLIAGSGLALFAVLAIGSYFLPFLGVSDLGAFAGNLLHGQGGGLLHRKLSSNLATLTASPLSPLVPVVMVVAGVALWRVRTRAPEQCFLGWLGWLVLLIGWAADDSGVIVPAAALPFVVPVLLLMMAPGRRQPGVAVSPGAARAGYLVSARLAHWREP